MGVTPAIDLTAGQRRTVLALLSRHLPNTAVWACGSRVKWTSHPASDLDLVAFAEAEQAARVAELREAFDESNLPFRVDLFVWDDVPRDFRKRIETEHVVLAEKERRLCKDYKEWPMVALGDCIEINTAVYSPRERWTFVNYLDTGNITENRIGEIRHLISGEDKIPSRARRKARSGDMLYSTVRPNQRHFGLLKKVPENFLASTGFSVIRGREDCARTDFIYRFLAQDSVVEHLQTIAEHSTSAYPSIRPADIERLMLHLPPLPEQHAIAHILGVFDDKIELNRRMGETLEEAVRALFKSWFVDFDPVKDRSRDNGDFPFHRAFPTGFLDSSCGLVPAGWEVKPVGEICAIFGGATPSTKVDDYWQDGAWCWATPKDLSRLSNSVLIDTARKITDAGLRQIPSGLLPKGTVLMSSRAPIGYLAIADMPVSVNQGFIAMVPDRGVPSSYLLNWCRFHDDAILSVANGSTFLEVAKRNFRKLDVVVPTAQVMAAFDGFSEAVYHRIALNARESVRLTGLRDVLLPKLLSGEIRISEAEKIVEAAT